VPHAQAKSYRESSDRTFSFSIVSMRNPSGIIS
jgi:hypothetical protein